jgi:hypothetical protein
LVDLTFPRLSTGDSKTPFQTVHADFPHTAYGWSDEMRHYAASGYTTVPRRRCSPRA